MGAALTFPRVERPTVSVVMLTYGAWEWVRRSLEALIQNTDPCYEVIVVDNASPDGTAEMLRAHVRGATMVFNERNLGFGPGTNQGAARAVGRYLCLLNSDAMVQPGWLPPLLDLLETEARAGAVSPAFFNLDGSMQEAGSLIGSDGATLAFGFGEDPGDLGFRFRRDVDYVSAACLLLRRSAFLAVGGFDPAYLPAYCEDVDLCFALHERGLRTVYQPASRVLHVRAASSDHVVAGRLIEKNRRLLRERWGAKLARRPALEDLADYPHRIAAARDAEALDRILLLHDRIAPPEASLEDSRPVRLAGALAELWPESRVTLLAGRGPEDPSGLLPLLDRGVEVVHGQDERRFFDSRLFHYSVVIAGPETLQRFDASLRRTQPQALVVCDLGTGSEPSESWAARRRETPADPLPRAEAILCVSEAEQSLARSLVPHAASFLLPDPVDALPRPPGFEERRDLVALLEPRPPARSDEALGLAEGLRASLRALDGGLGMVLWDPGRVEDLPAGELGWAPPGTDPAALLARARVNVALLRAGRGSRGELLRSIEAGLPFVTWKERLEGLGLGALEPYLAVEEASDLPHRIWSLYSRRDLWERVQRGLLQVAAGRFGRGAFRRALVEAMSHLGVGPPERARARLPVA